MSFMQKTVSFQDFYKICRICLCEGNLKNLFENHLDPESILEKLLSCTLIQFEIDDGLPDKICTNCIEKINSLFAFAKLCESSDTILRKCLEVMELANINELNNNIKKNQNTITFTISTCQDNAANSINTMPPATAATTIKENNPVKQIQSPVMLASNLNTTNSEKQLLVQNKSGGKSVLPTAKMTVGKGRIPSVRTPRTNEKQIRKTFPLTQRIFCADNVTNRGGKNLPHSNASKLKNVRSGSVTNLVGKNIPISNPSKLKISGVKILSHSSPKNEEDMVNPAIPNKRTVPSDRLFKVIQPQARNTERLATQNVVKVNEKNELCPKSTVKSSELISFNSGINGDRFVKENHQLQKLPRILRKPRVKVLNRINMNQSGRVNISGLIPSNESAKLLGTDDINLLKVDSNVASVETDLGNADGRVIVEIGAASYQDGSGSKNCAEVSSHTYTNSNKSDHNVTNTTNTTDSQGQHETNNTLSVTSTDQSVTTLTCSRSDLTTFSFYYPELHIPADQPITTLESLDRDPLLISLDESQSSTPIVQPTIINKSVESELELLFFGQTQSTDQQPAIKPVSSESEVMEIDQAGSGTFVTQTVNELFSSDLATDPIISEDSQTHTCVLCGKKFGSNFNLRRHIQLHTDELSYICEICGLGFIQLVTLMEHKKKHRGEKQFMCWCGQGFTRAVNLNKHLQKHQGQETLPCDKCPATFSTKFELKTHIQDTHTDKHLCDECGKVFSSKNSLEVHSKIHRGEKDEECLTCGKRFRQKAALYTHSFVHTGQKKHICKCCDRSFTQKNHLDQHLRTHTNERPYTCTYCGKTFASKGNLTVHVRVHTAETPYVCPICEKGFHESYSLKKHLLSHSKTDKPKKNQN